MGVKIISLILAIAISLPSSVIAGVNGKVDEKIKKIFPGFQKYDMESRVLNSQKFKVLTVLAEGKFSGWAVVVDEPGKTHPITFIVGIDNQGKVLDVDILEYREAIGYGIKRKSFLRQFRGKTSKDRISVGRDIDAVAGATISSDAAATAVKKSLKLIEELYR